MNKIIVIDGNDQNLCLEVGRKIAESYHIPCYWKRIRKMVSRECDVPEDELYTNRSAAVRDVFSIAIFMMMKKGSCVFVGNGAAHVLSHTEDVLSVMLISDHSTDESYDKYFENLTGSGMKKYLDFGFVIRIKDQTADELALAVRKMADLP